MMTDVLHCYNFGSTLDTWYRRSDGSSGCWHLGCSSTVVVYLAFCLLGRLVGLLGRCNDAATRLAILDWDYRARIEALHCLLAKHQTFRSFRFLGQV